MMSPAEGLLIEVLYKTTLLEKRLIELEKTITHLLDAKYKEQNDSIKTQN